jgi:hypothetical protein
MLKMNKNDIKENPEPIIPQPEIKKYGYAERDPNKKLTYYERVMLMFDNKTPQHLQTPWNLKTPWGKTKSVISTTLAVFFCYIDDFGSYIDQLFLWLHFH